MKNSIIKMGVIVVLALFCFASISIADDKRKKDNPGKDDRPAGWSEGQKTGWDSDTPPGLTKEKQKDGSASDIDSDADDPTVKKEKKEKKQKKQKKEKKAGAEEET